MWGWKTFPFSSSIGRGKMRDRAQAVQRFSQGEKESGHKFSIIATRIASFNAGEFDLIFNNHNEY